MHWRLISLGQDPKERERLRIAAQPQVFPSLTVRAPAPWHEHVDSAKQTVSDTLLTLHPVMPGLREVNTVTYLWRYLSQFISTDLESPICPHSLCGPEQAERGAWRRGN